MQAKEQLTCPNQFSYKLPRIRHPQKPMIPQKPIYMQFSGSAYINSKTDLYSAMQGLRYEIIQLQHPSPFLRRRIPASFLPDSARKRQNM
jgi:hypothetical protein